MTKFKSALYVLCIFMFLLAGFVIFMESSEAATYNFIFNNTEQGDNSTATPNVSVQDGKLVPNSNTLGSPTTNSFTMPNGPGSSTQNILQSNVEQSGQTTPYRWKIFLGFSGSSTFQDARPSEIVAAGAKYFPTQATLAFNYKISNHLFTNLEGFFLGKDPAESKSYVYSSNSPGRWIEEKGGRIEASRGVNFGLGLGYEFLKSRPTSNTSISFAALGGLQSLTSLRYSVKKISGEVSTLTATEFSKEWNPYAGLQLQWEALDSIGIQLKARRLMTAKMNYLSAGVSHAF